MNKKSSIILIIVLSLVIISSSIFSLILINSNNTIRVSLENVYQKSLNDLVKNIDDVEVGISKLVATNNSKTQKKILDDLYVNCVLASANLSQLPISSNKVISVTNFINTCGGYMYSLSEKIDSGNTLNDSDFNNVESLLGQSKIVLYDITNFISSLSYDYLVLNNVTLSDGENSEFTAGLTSNENTVSKEPSLIYDGPFSESVVNKKINGLPETIISKEEGDKKANSLLKYFNGFSVKYLGDTTGKFETYNYSLSQNENVLFVQISKRGGVLLNITSSNIGGNKNLTKFECEKIAKSIAYEFGFADLYSVWDLELNNVIYINLAPIYDGVIYYPDLIKVKIDKTSGVIIGWEAQNYAYNHVEREDFPNGIGILIGEQLLNNKLTVIERNYSVIPNEFSGESYAYEYICSWDEYTYYIYLDAITGEELNILRVVKTTNGDLLF